MLFFVHIPKNGGTTLHHYLGKFYKNQHADLNEPENEKKYTKRSKFNEVTISLEVLRNDFLYAKGHIHRSNIYSNDHNDKFVTFIRNPIERTLSNFNWLKQHVQEDHPLTTMDFKTFILDFSNHRLSFANEQVMYILKNLDPHRDSLSLSSPNLSTNMKKIVYEEIDQSIKGFDVLLPLDKLTAWIREQKLSNRFWGKIICANQNCYDKSALNDQELIDLINNLNWADNYLWHICCKQEC